MGQIPQDGGNGQNVAFLSFFWSSTVTKRLISFEFFCPINSKNVFLLALAHVEPELELFVEVDGIGDDGDDDL